MESSIVMLVAMLAVMYFLIIRPENQRKKKAQEMRDSLKKGDVVTTAGGLVGKIVHVNADTVIIETSEDRVRVEMTKWAVSSKGLQNTEQAENAGENSKKLKAHEAESSDDGEKS